MPKIEGQLPLEDGGDIEHTLYAHRDKDSNWNVWEEELHQDDETAGRTFSYALYEIGVRCRINLTTGEVTILGIEDGAEVVPLEREIKGT